MAPRIEDYALLGDTQTAALVGRDGSIDWLCMPRFDSGALFAALLGTEDHGRWRIAPAGEVRRVERRYRDGSLVLETDFETEEGAVRITDCMPPRGEELDLVRMVEGLRGRVPMHLRLKMRPDYGTIVPWVRRTAYGIEGVAGPDAIEIRTDVELHGRRFGTEADFTVSEGQRVPFVLVWHPSHRPCPGPIDAEASIRQTDRFWRDWSERCAYHGPYREAVVRSLVTLKALTYAPTGGIAAAPTTSLPEQIGGVRNWDYRYCWLRDATFTLYSLLTAGYEEEASAWRDWLLRAVAGRPSELQIMYGLAGERRLTELELPWLPGYEGSAPVRIGNAASLQFQLDVYGEVMDLLHQAARAGMDHEENTWRIQQAILEELEGCWREPDEGIWEVRGPRRHFTHSKVMAWLAFDRGIRDVERFGVEGPVDQWRAARREIHEEVCREGFDPELDSFVQSYGDKELDASLLMIPLIGFLPPEDPRVLGTIRAIEERLTHAGFVHRYSTASGVDGLPGGEGVFLMCTFWLADSYVACGRLEDARALFERLLDLRNDVGLLSEEYDPASDRLLGNFPQAFSHVSLVDTAWNLTYPESGPARHRRYHSTAGRDRPAGA